MMRSLAILPPCPMEAPDLRRALAAIDNRFGGPKGEVVLAGDGAAKQLLATAQAGHVALDWPAEDGVRFDAFDNLVFIEGLRGESWLSTWRAQLVCQDVRLYSVHMATKVRLEWPETYDAQEYPSVDAHLFNQVSRRRNGYAYTPYGPILSDVELGSVNACGFRVNADCDALRHRPSQHKVVAVFGGSAAFSYYCFDHETFSAVLEDRLNQRFAGAALRFSVLNFGMHDNVVMQEMINYLVHAALLRPDVVIAHDGHNDMYYGLQADPLLLNDHSMIYQSLHVEWAKLLQGTGAVPTPECYSNSVDCLQMNLPDNVIDVYVERKRQFQKVVEGDGGLFIWGVQPLLCSKGALNRREVMRAGIVGDWDTRPTRHRFRQSMNHIYGMLSARLAGMKDIRLVDFHRHFTSFGDDRELFWDYCHLSPEGDSEIAAAYADEVAKNFGA